MKSSYERVLYYQGIQQKANVTFVVHKLNTELMWPCLSHFLSPAPCLPTNIRTIAACDSDLLTTTWDDAAGALSYTVEAEGNTGEMYNCTSDSNSCELGGVACGQYLSVWITASNENCSTDKVLGEVAQTGKY